jgi:hypothetical protein
MHCVLGRHKAEVDAWKKAVESDNRPNLEAGLYFQQVWSNAEDPNEILHVQA